MKWELFLINKIFRDILHPRLIIISNIALFQFCIYMSKKQLQKQIEVVAEEQKPDKEQKSKPDKEQVKKVVS